MWRTNLDSKVCTKCGEVKPLSAFYIDKRNKSGRRCDCALCNNKKCKEYAEKNQDKIVANYYKKQAHKLAVCKAYKDSHKEERKEVARAWEKVNTAKRRAQGSAYYHRKRNAVPSWADSRAMEIVYAKARRLSVWLDKPFEVDHIVPVTSVHVCGLHCEANLAIISMSENQSKSNLHWPDMWEGYSRLRPRNGTPGWYVPEEDVLAWYVNSPERLTMDDGNSNSAATGL